MSKINFPKKQEQRLIPKYLLEYAEELQENHPDPSASWGGGSGGDYTAGEGIVIENNEISVDAEDVALVKNLATVAFSGSYSDLSNKPDLSVYELKSDAFSGDYDDLTNKPDLSVYELKADAFSGDYNDLTNKPTLFSGDYDDLTDKPDLSIYETKAEAFSGDYNDLTNKPTIPTVNDPTITFTQGGVTKGTITLNQSSNQTIALDAGGGGSTYTAGNGIDITNDVISIDNTVALKSDIPTVPTKTSDLTNDSGFITDAALANYEVKFTLMDTPGSSSGTLDANTLAKIVANPESFMFRATGDANTYLTLARNDGFYLYYEGLYHYLAGNKVFCRVFRITMSNGAWTYSTKYTDNIVTGTNDGTNWTSITIGDTTKSIPSGGSNYTAGTGIDITNDTISIDNTVALKSEIPTVPTNVSAFTNDAGYITSSALPDMTDYYTKTEINTNYYDRTDVDDIVDNVAADIPEIFANLPNPTTALTSLSINNTNYSIPTVPTNVSAFTNDAGYITNTVNNLTNYTLSSNLATVATTGSYNDLTNKPTIPDIYYHNGDKYTNTNYYQLYGYITNGSKDIQFTVTFNKSLANISSITANKLSFIARGVGGYVGATAYTDYVSTSGYTILSNISSENAVTITVRGTNAWSGATNNTPVVLVFSSTAGSLDLTFNS